MKDSKLQISKDYLHRYSAEHFGHKYELLDWMIKYCRRNKIKIEEKHFPKWGRFGETGTAFELTFKSDNQLNWFVRHGNMMFPYFEFF